MLRIVSAVVLSGLLAACGQPSEPQTDAGAAAPLDYIDAVPIDEDAPPPVVQPEPAAKKSETEEPATEPTAEAEAPAAPQPAAPVAAEPEARPDDAAEATRRANETTPAPPAGAADDATPRAD
jgi:hypothetical protein